MSPIALVTVSGHPRMTNRTPLARRDLRHTPISPPAKPPPAPARLHSGLRFSHWSRYVLLVGRGERLLLLANVTVPLLTCCRRARSHVPCAHSLTITECIDNWIHGDPGDLIHPYRITKTWLPTTKGNLRRFISDYHKGILNGMPEICSFIITRAHRSSRQAARLKFDQPCPAFVLPMRPKGISPRWHACSLEAQIIYQITIQFVVLRMAEPYSPGLLANATVPPSFLLAWCRTAFPHLIYLVSYAHPIPIPERIDNWILEILFIHRIAKTWLQTTKGNMRRLIQTTRKDY
jgi:hypothetical protein